MYTSRGGGGRINRILDWGTEAPFNAIQSTEQGLVSELKGGREGREIERSKGLINWGGLGGGEGESLCRLV